MKLRQFEQLALEYWEEIPDEYKSGIDGVRVLRRSKAHDELPDVYTMGECLTETYPSDFGGAETTRSAVVLYHGSFAALAQLDPDFEWEEELWETLTHELQHHLESLAGEDALEDVDYAADENFKRLEGDPFDPLFYRAGHPLGGDDLPSIRLDDGEPMTCAAWRVEGDRFVEVSYAQRPPAGRTTVEWQGARYVFALPDVTADVAYVALGDGFVAPPRARNRIDEVNVVLVRREAAWRALFGLFAPRLRQRSIAEYVVDVATESERR